MNYNHITINERACIYQFKQLGMSIRKIAEALNRSPSTISRELKRNYCGKRYKYLPHIAEEKYNKRRINCHRHIKVDIKAKKYIENKIQINWSPEQIYNYKNGRPNYLPSVSTMYRWVRKGLLINGDTNKLRRKGKMTDKKETRGKFNIGKRIKKRPKEVYQRKTFGHWEADTVVSGRNDRTYKSSYCFVTLAERKSRLYLCKQLPNRKAENVTKAIIKILRQFPPELVKTITCDRGKEFAGWEEIEERLKCQMYFADPFCAWQKGTNENSNGLLREYYPKGMDLSKTNNDELNEKLDLINNRPRKCIGYKTPNEVITEVLSKCCT